MGAEGALQCKDTNNQLRIVENYFDAEGIGINADRLSEAIISDNIFYRPDQAILIQEITMSTIANNVFRDCDRHDNGYADIKITSRQGGNSFIGNKHFRSESITHTNKSYAYDIPNRDEQ